MSRLKDFGVTKLYFATPPDPDVLSSALWVVERTSGDDTESAEGVADPRAETDTDG